MVETGIVRLLRESPAWLRQARIGLVSHPAAVLPDLTSTLDALLDAGARLSALYGPEHGFDGSAADGASVADAVHPRTGLPVFSLYGPTKEPTPEMLDGVDVLLFDMQDVGARFYTFISTLYCLLRGAARADRRVVVLDRSNPIGGEAVEGPHIQPGLESFVGILPVPIRHGLTTGELARYMNDRCALGAELDIIPMAGWQRRMWFDETGQPWTPPSPAMPRLSTATVYPGLCLVEGTNLSEGRGTALPFEVVGAPWCDGYEISRRLNALDLPGVRFRPAHFVPSTSKHAGVTCRGVQVHVTGRSVYRAVETGLHVVAAFLADAPDRCTFLPSSWEGRPPHFDLLAGDAAIREGLVAGVPVTNLVAGWAESECEFRRKCAPYLLYG
jgi:uncharacterized protein YbbC (DUF1343 family)